MKIERLISRTLKIKTCVDLRFPSETRVYPITLKYPKIKNFKFICQKKKKKPVRFRLHENSPPFAFGTQHCVHTYVRPFVRCLSITITTLLNTIRVVVVETESTKQQYLAENTVFGGNNYHLDDTQ